MKSRGETGHTSVRGTESIEHVVLGGGEAGKYIAWELAKQGSPVVVIERALVGGSCPNIACLPSKNVIRTAQVADLVSHAVAYGIHTGDVRVAKAIAAALEQQINAAEVPDELKVKLQGYVTGCYGTLTSFNVLFADEADRFKGSGGSD